MKCPECGCRCLKIEVLFRGKVACRFFDGEEFEVLEPASFGSEWTDESGCECMDCPWTGTVFLARPPQGN